MKRVKNKIKFILSVAVLTTSITTLSMAQVESGATGYYNFVPTFSGESVAGTARIQGLAGSGVSLGGDIGLITINPASLGFFRKSEISISTGIGSNSAQSNFLGSSSHGNKTWFGIPNFGAVINFSKDDLVPGIFRGGSLGISFTKTNNYQQRLQMSGVNNKNSMTDFFAEYANNALHSSGGSFANVYNQDYNMPNTLDALGYYSYLIDYDSSSNSYYPGVGYYNINNGGHYDYGGNYYQFPNNQAKQMETVTRKGGQYSWDLSYGANINDRVYLGIGGSMLITNYQQQRLYQETLLNGVGSLKDFSYTEIDNHRGTGFLLKAGAIIKATDWMRIGASIHSPTYNYMRETYNYGVVSNFDNIITNNDPNNFQQLSHADVKTTTNSFIYRYVKPMRATAGITLLAGKRGFITADVEYVPYKTASLQLPGNTSYFTADNTTIGNIYNNVVNYKFGAEIKIARQFSARGGFAYYADPYNHIDDLKRDQYNFTTGFGYRIEGFYVDLSVVQAFSKERYKPYTLANQQEPTADIKKHYGFYQVTMGFTF